ncbi:DNA polymerase III subunit beta, partial [Acinetobacter baumannii]|uniref:hypothetical protein n=1 Tax=Acinetobacter baumannii TaxID=470 RepID=UPI0018E093C7
IILRVLDGAFPPYERLIPKETQRTAAFSRAGALDALRRVQIVAKNAMQKSVWCFDREGLTLGAESQDVGRALEELPCTFAGQERFTMAFNVGYAVESLAALSDETVTLEMQGALQPAVLRSPSRPDWLY